MKKILAFILVVFTFFFVGCRKDPFQFYISKIAVPPVASEEILLPAQVTNDGKHDIYWTSDSASFFIYNSLFKEKAGLRYYVTSVSPQKDDVVVHLTMRLEVRGYGFKEKIYVVKIPALKVESDIVSFTFFALNDFHGAVESKNGGISVIGNYLIQEEEKDKEHTLLVSTGDMFQGSALSNITKGAVLVEAMNKIGFAAMAIGNHEFDWGYEVIRDYNSGKGPVRSSFPFIACNIYDKETKKPVSWSQPYTVVTKAGLKIGIIGAIGSGLENTIATKFIAPFYFEEPLPLVKNYARVLRRDEGCAIVVLAIHADTQNLNQSYADLGFDAKIDAVFNGHTHMVYAGETVGWAQIPMPYIQSGSYGSYVGKITLDYDKKAKKVIDAAAENIPMSPNVARQNPEIEAIVLRYKKQVSKTIDEVLGRAGEKITRNAAAIWAANVIQDANQADVGFINYGGIRAGAFPIAKGEAVPVSKIWEIMPFDNYVKTCILSTPDVIRCYNGSDIVHSSNVAVKNGELYISGIKQDAKAKFLVATVDYLFDKKGSPYLKGEDSKNTGILFRDQLIAAVRMSAQGGEWHLDQP